MAEEKRATYEDILNIVQRRSLFFPASEIYEGYPGGFFDFGPYGAALKRNIVEMWRNELVKKEEFIEIDGAIVMPEDVFNSSGHLKGFKDPITTCGKCKAVFRADKILEEHAKGETFREAMSEKELTESLRKYKICCPNCKGNLSDVERASLMVKAVVGVCGNKPAYLRPESCQSIFLDFARMNKTMRLKLPKGISQYGKVFRNEISPRQTLLRTVEFTQMESEVFFDPAKINDIENYSEIENYEVMLQRHNEKEAKPVKVKELIAKKIVSGKIIGYYLARTQQLYELYGFSREKMRFRELDSDERAFYAKEAFDFEVMTSVGWLELIANNYRTDYDLKGHMEGSKKDLRYVYDDGTKVLPHVWEISIGTDRTLFAILDNSTKMGKEGFYLSLPQKLSPVKAAVFPLLSNKDELVGKSKEVYLMLKNKIDCAFDSAGSIGKRYARQDEIGTPYCITIDHDSLKNDDVTIRDRDTTEQKRIKTGKLGETLAKLLSKEIDFKSIK